MNERIKELAEQCWVQRVVDFHTGRVSSDPYDGYFEYDKFAELIVRDMMDYASRNWEHGHLLAEDIKAHFGVE